MPPRSFPFYQIDAFSSKPFGGNPAAVILIERATDLSDEERQMIAAENNLAETAFVAPVSAHATHAWSRRLIELLQHKPAADGDSEDPFRTQNEFTLRWFTPTVEVPM